MILVKFLSQIDNAEREVYAKERRAERMKKSSEVLDKMNREKAHKLQQNYIIAFDNLDRVTATFKPNTPDIPNDSAQNPDENMEECSEEKEENKNEGIASLDGKTTEWRSEYKDYNSSHVRSMDKILPEQDVKILENGGEIKLDLNTDDD